MNTIAVPNAALQLLAALGDPPVLDSGIAPWVVGPFRFEASTAQLAAGAVFCNLRTPAQRLDPQLAQIEGVAAGTGASDPKIAIGIAAVSVSVPANTAPEAIRELSQRCYIRIERGQNTVFYPLIGCAGNTVTGIAVADPAAPSLVGARGEPFAVIPFSEVNLATDQVGIVYDGAAPLVLSLNPVPVIVQIAGVARDSNGWSRPAGCRPAVLASPNEAREIAARSVGHARVTT